MEHKFHYRQQSLPLLLTEYGLEDDAARKRKQAAETAKSQFKTARKQHRGILHKTYDVQDERALRRQKEKDEYYLQIIQDMYRLRNYYYQEYANRLTQKVLRQRQEIQEKEIQRREKQEKKEEEERQATHKVKKRLERHTLKTNSTRVAAPKSDVYHTVGLDGKTGHKGKLTRTNSDSSGFKVKGHDPQVFVANLKEKQYLDLKKHPDNTANEAANHNEVQTLDQSLSPGADNSYNISHSSQELRALSRISEAKDLSRPETKTDSWAITQQFPAQYSKERKSISSRHTSKLKQDTQSDLDKRFPKLEMPKLHCFTMRLDSEPPDPQQIQQKAELKAKEKNRKIMMRKMTKMYQLAMSNMATAARLLDKHKDMNLLFNGADVGDLMSGPYWREIHDSHVPDVTGPADQQKTHADVQETEEGVLVMVEGENVASDDTASSKSTSLEGGGVCEECDDAACTQSTLEVGAASDEESQSRKDSDNSKNDLIMKTLPQPLTMEEIHKKCNIVESKSLSTFWTNYTAAGK